LHLAAAKCERRDGDLHQAVQRLHEIDCAAIEPDIAAMIQYELGLLYDRLEDSDNAFACFTEANRLQGEGLAGENGDQHQYLQVIDALREDITAKRVAVWDPYLADKGRSAPVFLIGFPRSGTTLLDQVLDSHPRIRTLEEKPLVAELFRRVQDMPGGFLAALDRIGTEQVEQLREEYFRLAVQYVELHPGEILVDKLPLNIPRIPLIWRIFPEAKFILALRHPADVCLSCFMHLFDPNEAMAGLSTLEDTVRMYTGVMGLWRHYSGILPLDYHVIKYEDVVADLESESRSLLDFIGVEWDEGVLNFHEHALGRGKIDTPSYYQVTQPVYRQAVYRWRRYRKQLEPVMEGLAPLVRDFGYGMDY
ncbi:MAG: sulfotransferase, partial [Gammaproteobacteria bacterium]|nr:sulfotransferase [Gammaproteobacteria bacterium]